MKLLIASDIHGSEYYCRMLAVRFEAEAAERILLLGDLLYHGPRNPLPPEYNPAGVAAILNSYKNSIICVHGNCDSEVDQMMLEFSLTPEYAFLYDRTYAFYASHGHKTGESNPPPLRSGDILLCGHTHIPAFVRHEYFTYVNPGSVSIPKESSVPSYMIYDSGVFTWKNIDGHIYSEESIDK